MSSFVMNLHVGKFGNELGETCLAIEAVVSIPVEAAVVAENLILMSRRAVSTEPFLEITLTTPGEASGV